MRQPFDWGETCCFAQYNVSKGHVSAILPKAKYHKFAQRVQESPIFVLPSKKPEGYVSIFLQHQVNLRHCRSHPPPVRSLTTTRGHIAS